MNFKDHFSNHAALYHRYRPDYPAALYRYLADKVPHHAHAWDCATGNGQAAIGLAEYFDKVVATDASTAQLSQTIAHPRINYLVTPAEQAPFADRPLVATRTDVYRKRLPGSSLFPEEISPSFAMEAQWDLPQLIGYLRTWSAVQRFQKEQNTDPVALIETELTTRWGDPRQTRPIRWSLSLRLGHRR